MGLRLGLALLLGHGREARRYELVDLVRVGDGRFGFGFGIGLGLGLGLGWVVPPPFFSVQCSLRTSRPRAMSTSVGVSSTIGVKVPAANWLGLGLG